MNRLCLATNQRIKNPEPINIQASHTSINSTKHLNFWRKNNFLHPKISSMLFMKDNHLIAIK